MASGLTLNFSPLTRQRFYSLLPPTLRHVYKPFSRCKCLPEWQFGDGVPMPARAHCGVLFLLSWHRKLPLPGRTTHPSSWPSLKLPQRLRSHPFTQVWIKHFLLQAREVPSVPSPGPQMVSKVRSGKSYDHSQGASAMSYSTGGGVGGSEQKASPSHPSLAFPGFSYCSLKGTYAISSPMTFLHNVCPLPPPFLLFS